MSIVVLRIVSSAFWVLLLWFFRKPARRTATWPADLQPWEALMGATWLLAGNRLTFLAVAQFDPGDEFAAICCQTYAVIGAALMLLASVWALRFYGRG